MRRRRPLQAGERDGGGAAGRCDHRQPRGAPRDIDLYQSQKALSVAELICREPCVFILVAACSDGFGEGSFREIMETYADPDEIIGAYAREGFTVGATKPSTMPGP